MDIGHVRNLTWSKDNSEAWIGYNRLRGQYMSALEHAVRSDSLMIQTNAMYRKSSKQSKLVCVPQGISAIRLWHWLDKQDKNLYHHQRYLSEQL